MSLTPMRLQSLRQLSRLLRLRAARAASFAAAGSTNHSIAISQRSRLDIVCELWTLDLARNDLNELAARLAHIPEEMLHFCVETNFDTDRIEIED